MIGQQVGSFQITMKLAEGGMGVVYAARHPLIGKRAAVKMLLSQFSANPVILERFFNEARALSTLKHPGIIEVYDFGKLPNGSAFIVMELLEGESLGERMRRDGKLPLDLAIDLARQAAAALGAAHRVGILHRDLKPDNLFLTEDPELPSGVRLRVIDFGLAKLSDGGPAMTARGALLGTPGYMSPEQYSDASSVDPRTDVYALGCVILEMVTGHALFPFTTAGEIIAAQIAGMTPVIEPEVPTALAAVLRRAIARLPDERHPSMAAMVGELEELSLSGMRRRYDVTGHTVALVPPGIEVNAHKARPTMAPPVPGDGLDDDTLRDQRTFSDGFAKTIPGLASRDFAPIGAEPDPDPVEHTTLRRSPRPAPAVAPSPLPSPGGSHKAPDSITSPGPSSLDAIPRSPWARRAPLLAAAVVGILLAALLLWLSRAPPPAG